MGDGGDMKKRYVSKLTHRTTLFVSFLFAFELEYLELEYLELHNERPQKYLYRRNGCHLE